MTYANGAGNGQFQVLLPQHIAAETVHGHDHAFDIGGIDMVAIDSWGEQVVTLALTIADGTAPLALELNLSGELRQLGWRQFLFAVAAATHDRNGQGQQCGVLPTHHVMHPLWPDRRS